LTEIGLAFQGASVVGFQRYRDSAGLVATFTGHEAQVSCDQFDLNLLTIILMATLSVPLSLTLLVLDPYGFVLTYADIL